MKAPPPPPPEPPPAPAPSPNPWDEVESQSAPDPAPREKSPPTRSSPRKRRDDSDEEPRPRNARGRGRDEAPPTERGPKTWTKFGAGCSLAWWGLWIEFVAYAYGVAMTGYIFLGLLTDQRGMVLKINDAGGPMVFVPFFVGIAIGTLLTLVGRTRMMNIPPGTGAKKVFFGAWAFTLLRFLSAVGSAVLIAVAASQWADLRTATDTELDTKGKNAFICFVGAFAAFAVGVPFWVLADLSTIPGMAIVGGEIPSTRLRQRSGLVTFVLQFMVLLYVGVVAGGIYAGQKADFSPPPKTSATSNTTVTGVKDTTTKSVTTYSKEPDIDQVKAVTMFVLGLALVIQLAYTALFGCLYGAGRQAASDAREAIERAEDEDG